MTYLLYDESPMIIFVLQLGQLSYKQGRVDEAIEHFIQDLAMTRADVGTSHPRMASKCLLPLSCDVIVVVVTHHRMCAGVINDIALVYDDKNESIAGDLYEAALVILLDTFGNQHLDVAVTRCVVLCTCVTVVHTTFVYSTFH